MNHQQIREELSKAEQAVEQLKKLLNEPQGVWRPKHGQDGYIVSGEGVIYGGGHGWNALAYYAIGNCFPTKEAAELHVKRLKVIQKLKEMAGGYVPKFNGDDPVYPFYDHSMKKWQFYKANLNQYSFLPHFKDREAAQAAITTLGDELNVLLD